MFLKNSLYRLMPHKEQFVCERKLKKLMRRLKIDEYHFNWDRMGCYIDFEYKNQPYRVEHSVQRAKEKGIILRNGLDCLYELILTLENLSEITGRGTYELETWISGMQHKTSKEEIPAFEEELHIRYKSLANQQPPSPSYKREEQFIPEEPDLPLRRSFNRSQLLQRSHRE